MTILHTSDIHFSREHQVEALASLTVLAETAEREKPALVAISGDLFDRGAQNSTAGGFPALLAVIQRILDVCPIAAVHGTPTHDLPGCYDALERLSAGHGFAMLDPSKTYALYGCGYIAEWGQREEDYDKPQLLVLGMPEPTREWLLAGKEGASSQEAAEAMQTALRSILLGLGVVRAQHPELPCVMLYHGPVEGASMQNGQTIGAGSITIGREDLALVGADYFALGDIHLAQQIPGLPAYYPGSAYPVSWGELGTSGFNQVEIYASHTQAPEDLTEGPYSGHAFPSIVTRVEYPHPRRVKFTLPWPEPAGPEVEGVQAWICYRATKEDAAKIDCESYLNSYLLAGALPGSRVTVELIPTETVRAAEITEKHRLREKIVVYAEASATEKTSFIQDIAESILSKADQLEREAAERGSTAGMHFRVRRLRLRGAVGIWKGLRQDEIDIDLDKYDPGLIALIGANGAGKSTSIENMHPYSCMLTRDGPLQDHFRLRDSARELWFVDERTGTEYRTLMEIDGANATGSVKYHLFRNGEPITNGRKADYDEAVEKLIGTLPLFLRSAFVSQRPTKSNPDLSDATKGEKKAIFRELAGLDYMQAYAESAKGKAGAIEAWISVERGRITLIESQLVALPGITGDRDTAASDMGVRNLALAQLAATGSTLKIEAEQLSQKVAEQRSLAERITGLEEQLTQKQQVIALACEAIKGYQDALEWNPLAKKVIATYEDLKEQENAENGRLSAINADNARLQGEYNTRLQAHHSDIRKVEGERSTLKTQSASVAGDRNVLQAQIDHLAADLGVPLKENCPTCGQLLPETKLAELKQKRAQSETKLAELKQKHAATGQQIAEIDKQLASIVLPTALPALELPPVDQAPLKRIQGALAVLKIAEARKTLATAQEAATRIEEATKRQAEAEAEVTGLSTEIFEAQGTLDPTVQIDYEAAQEKLEAARRNYGEAQKVIAALEAQIHGLDKRIAELQASEKDLSERKEKMEQQQAEAAESRYLETACGPDGIQALELDAMGPSISEVANKLLSAAYGSRFKIELRTTRIAGKGSKTKQVEDFAIIVLDNELLTEQPIETLSGGESVWIKRALYDSFALIRDRTTGIRFLTVFADEADGALDLESRQKYFAMLEAAHQESGRRHTIVITHSPEAQEAIGQKIEMRRSV